MVIVNSHLVLRDIRGIYGIKKLWYKSAIKIFDTGTFKTKTWMFSEILLFDKSYTFCSSE